jgi:hypothetical protein
LRPDGKNAAERENSPKSLCAADELGLVNAGKQQGFSS